MSEILSHAWELILIARANELWTKRAKVVELMGKILLEASDMMREDEAYAAMPVSPPDTLEECIAEIEQVVAASKSGAAAVHPALLVVIVQLCKLLLERVTPGS